MTVTVYEDVLVGLVKEPKKWLITGAAGFIGSNLLERLLGLNQVVVGLDDFSTGCRRNLEEVKASVTPTQWSRFRFIEGDIRNINDCRLACSGVDYILHQAALGSVPRSIEDPIATNSVNVSGFLNMLVSARDANVRNFVYAASSSVYGDTPGLPKKEEVIGRPLSPYAVSKYVNELYAGVFQRNYGIATIGLRYFNVFGKRQSPAGAYAAVIPKWIAAMTGDEDVYINGDGNTTRDFCFIENVIQANLLAAANRRADAWNQVYNVAVGDRITLNELFEELVRALLQNGIIYQKKPIYRGFREGDVRHSQADITKIARTLSYFPTFDVRAGIVESMPWYVAQL